MHSLPSVGHVLFGKPTSTRHEHSRSIVYIRVSPGIVYSMSWNKCIMAHMHHYSIIQNSFPDQKSPLTWNCVSNFKFYLFIAAIPESSLTLYINLASCNPATIAY